MRIESSNGLIWDLLTAIHRLLVPATQWSFIFVLIGFVGWGSYVVKKKEVTFNIQLLFWELPIYEKKKKSGTINIYEKQT